MGRVLFESLHPAWRCAFEEAWQSFRAGNFGIGAVLVDPIDDSLAALDL